jgi:hypothetical protein
LDFLPASALNTSAITAERLFAQVRCSSLTHTIYTPASRSPLSSACARQDSTRFPERHEMIPGDVDTF